MTLAFIDPHSARGGGQVVLEELLRLIEATHVPDVRLVMPTAGRSKLAIPSRVVGLDYRYWRRLAEGKGRLALVSNANASHVDCLRWSRALMRHREVVTIAVIHNYPGSRLRSFVVERVLRQFDHVIVVEPGLLELFPTAVQPSWLSIRASDLALGVASTSETAAVKAFARPDPVKGLHLLPGIFRIVERTGVECQVALGESVDGESGYSRRLRRDLGPWLVDGARNPGWLAPGDIFLAPTMAETACLAVQEAMARGAVVVASRVGLMSYLTPVQGPVRTFTPGNVEHGAQEVEEFLRMGPEDRRDLGVEGRRLVAERAGRWYDEVVQLLAGLL